MVLSDLRGSRPYLEAFIELVTDELACTTCPNVEQLTGIGNACHFINFLELMGDIGLVVSGRVTLLVAHLGCNYHLRFQFFLLTTHPEMMSVQQEDIFAASSCVEYLTSRLGVMLPGSNCRSSWNRLKQSAHKYVSSRCTSVSPLQLDDMFVENARQLATELALRVPWDVAEIFVHLFAFQRTAGIVGSGNLPFGDNMTNYLASSEMIGLVCPSDRFLGSIAFSRGLLMKSFDCALTAVEMHDLAQAVIWQTRNFIYHFEPDSLPFSEQLPTDYLLQQADSGARPSTESAMEAISIDVAATSAQTIVCSPEPAESLSSIRETMVKHFFFCAKAYNCSTRV